MSDILKEKVVKGVFWSGIGQAVSAVVAFISNIILARLLSPNDFGCIGVLAIFLAISATFINGGFGLALIQKKEVSQVDYSTIFYWNFLIAIFFVLILFFAAPHIANFYRIPLLKHVLRVQSIELIITAISIVPTNKLKKELKFKQLAIRTIISTTIATAISITVAFNGGGVWSLVVLTLSKALIIAILLWHMTKWRPSPIFSFNSFKSLFGFGSSMLLSSLIEVIYKNINGLIIGRYFTSKDMGYYEQARKLEEVPSLILTSIINEVSFSAFSKIQSEHARLRNGLRKNVNIISYIIFPLMSLLIVIAPELFKLLFTDKWLASVPYFRILCLASMFYTLNSVNESIIKALGKGKLFFRSNLIKKIIGICLIIAGIPFGIKGMIWGTVFSTWIAFIINFFINKKLISYDIKSLFSDILPYVALAFISAIITYALLFNAKLNYILIMCVKTLVFAIVYLSISILTKQQGFSLLIESLKSLGLKRNIKF